MDEKLYLNLIRRVLQHIDVEDLTHAEKQIVAILADYDIDGKECQNMDYRNNRSIERHT